MSGHWRSPKLDITHAVVNGKVAATTSAMYLVYAAENGQLHYQHWQDVTHVGGLIDPDTDLDMQIIGWTTDIPEWEEWECANCGADNEDKECRDCGQSVKRDSE